MDSSRSIRSNCWLSSLTASMVSLTVRYCLQSLAHLGNLLGAKAQLAGLTTGIVDIEHPERMTLATGALGTTAGVMKGALEQGSAQHVAETGEAGSQSVALKDGLLTCHLYG